MPSSYALAIAQRLQNECAKSSNFDAERIASMIDEELGFAEAIEALRRCDTLLEKLSVSVDERDFLLKALARLEGSAKTADLVIGSAP